MYEKDIGILPYIQTPAFILFYCVNKTLCVDCWVQANGAKIYHLSCITLSPM